MNKLLSCRFNMEEEAGRRIPADQFRSVWLYPQEW